jgi:hypothetical protein
MKKFEVLGRSLSKLEQKKIMGGDEEMGAGCNYGCTNNSECGTMVCSTTVVTSDCGTPGQTCPSIHQCVPR